MTFGPARLNEVAVLRVGLEHIPYIAIDACRLADGDRYRRGFDVVHKPVAMEPGLDAVAPGRPERVSGTEKLLPDLFRAPRFK